MSEKPILFDAESVRAILDGHKTQTRRPIRPQPVGADYWSRWPPNDGLAFYPNRDSEPHILYPPYNIGATLWTRETFFVQDWLGIPLREKQPIHYAADIKCRGEVEDYVCKASIHMPRWASRITLRVTGVRAERVQAISVADSLREGAPVFVPVSEFESKHEYRLRTWFIPTWDAIYAKRGLGWETNPWAWVIEFERVQP